jgi:hypothetical protein
MIQVRWILLLGIVFVFFSGFGGRPAVTVEGTSYIVGNTKQIVEGYVAEGRADGYFYYEEMARKFLHRFEGLPYGAGNVACPGDKTLINFHSFDCVTLLESWWALANTVYMYNSNKVPEFMEPFKVFAKNLNTIRYFGGENCGLEYRIHYFTQQMEELDRAGKVFNVGVANGEKFTKKIDYITKNPEDFGDFATSTRAKHLEKLLNATPKYFYPKDKIELYRPLAKDGDLVSLASSEPGLDVSHCGIITLEDGNLRITHASSKYERVVYAQDLEAYIRGRGGYVTGIFVYRPVFD